MLLNVTRENSTASSTPGILKVDDAFECYTLEPVVREVPNEDVADWKVEGKTAIPSGTYEVIIDLSAHFDRPMPHLVDVPGFEGILIHYGNTSADTEGCILVGNLRENPDEILQSRAAFDDLFKKIQDAIAVGEHIEITLESLVP